MKRILSIIVTAAALLAGSAAASATPYYIYAPRKVAQKDTLALVKAKAEKGDAVAQNQMGVWYYTGVKVEQDYAEALRWWTLSAKQKNPDGIGNMALCYLHGHGVQKDTVTALKLYKVAIEMGNKSVIPQYEAWAEQTGDAFSLRLLADCYQNGIGVERNAQKAEAYEERWATASGADAQFSLAVRYLNAKRPDKAAPLFAAVAKTGRKEAIYYCGYLQYYGMGVAQDKAAGLALMQQAADQGVKAAYYQLGRAYAEGDGTDKDIVKGKDWLGKCAATNKKAAWMLAIACLDDSAPDYRMAVQWLADAARSHEKEFNKLMAERQDSPFYNYVLGLKQYAVDKNYDAALQTFKAVEKAGNAEGTTMQAVILADAAYDKHNDKKALKLLEKAHADGSAYATWLLSDFYQKGRGMKKADAEKALALLQQAADNGVAEAQCALGDRLFTGDGLTQDASKAATYYLAAEAQSLLTPASAQNLIACYRRGLTVLPDVQNAETRIEQLQKVKPNTALMDMLKSITE